MDKIEDYRQESLKTPRGYNGICVTWQEYLLDCKEDIINLGKEWLPISELLSDIQLMQNEMLTQSLKDKEDFNKDADYGISLDDMFQKLSTDKKYNKPEEIMSKHEELSKEIIQYWIYNKLPVQVFKHNPAFQLYRKDSSILKQFKEKEIQMSYAFISGHPVRLSNLYIDMISYLTLFIDCLNKQKPSNIHHIFKHLYDPKECVVCHERFISKEKGGRKQKLCGKDTCDSEWRKRLAQDRRKRNKKT